MSADEIHDEAALRPIRLILDAYIAALNATLAPSVVYRTPFEHGLQSLGDDSALLP